LQEELSDIENKLAAARRFFNAATTEYNTGIETFPANLVAGSFGFNRETMFDLGERRVEMEEPPKISFS
ncbi:MAG: LemA family protein, partial [Mangrovibacterium sp.]